MSHTMVFLGQIRFLLLAKVVKFQLENNIQNNAYMYLLFPFLFHSHAMDDKATCGYHQRL
jgi:hypothetical protein